MKCAVETEWLSTSTTMVGAKDYADKVTHWEAQVLKFKRSCHIKCQLNVRIRNHEFQGKEPKMTGK